MKTILNKKKVMTIKNENEKRDRLRRIDNDFQENL